MFLAFIEYILENVNDVVCLSLLSNEINTDIFYENGNYTIETFISFAGMQDKPSLIKKIYYYIKNQVADDLPKEFWC